MSTSEAARIVHIGLGAFSRSHLAYYTQRASDASEWEIIAYTGRSRELADVLEAQGCTYHLIERAAAEDRIMPISSIVRARPGSEVSQLVADIADPRTRIVSLTVTEAAYHLTGSGTLNLQAPDIAHDLEVVQRVHEGVARSADLRTAVGKLATGLLARRAEESGPVTVVSCDNMPDNGERIRDAVLAFAGAAGTDLHTWIAEHVSFVSTSVDRITPRLGAEEKQRLEVAHHDKAVVVAEPFTDWVLEGKFPAGRPRWEDAGARFVNDLAPWESRKLWLLNGAHTILASLGLLRGHTNVHEAISDSECLEAVNSFWDEAARHLPEELDVPAYRQALIERFSNPRIEHRLAQIAQDSDIKAQMRILPVAQREIAAGRRAEGAARALAVCVAAHRYGGVEWPTLGPQVMGGAAQGGVPELHALWGGPAPSEVEQVVRHALDVLSLLPVSRG
ncbi:mannitol dehydrogenase family protein [Nesterenkonia rhizosphaerae]|uniref:Mannitol-1-phosphate 5-dehydrogenase n=1 Tax=Nesterenkonia rhizosphaerae TaxID=1348272 RepID=A0ABP9G341_9MICC